MTNLIEGKIISFDWSKGYGFIKNNEGSFFFHKRHLPKSVKHGGSLIETFFTFELTPTKKGMEARKLQKSLRYKILKPITKFIYSKSSTPKFGEVLVRTPVTSKMFDSPNEAKEYLKEAALASDCNALLNLKYIKDTFRSGNYYYTVHGYEADLALVLAPKYIKDASLLVKNQDEVNLLKEKATTLSTTQSEIIKEARAEQYKPDEGCFIATAVYGDIDCWEVRLFRKYRDEVLKKRWFGTLFISLYYFSSPTIVKYTYKNRRLMKTFRIILNYLLHHIILCK